MEGYVPIHLWNEDDRPREKLAAKGRGVLSDAELLAILLGTGARYKGEFGGQITRSALDLGKEILQKVDNNLINLARMTPEELMQVKGVGEAKAISIIAAMELGNRRNAFRGEETHIRGSLDAYRLLSPMMADLCEEQFWAVFLNQANRVLKVRKMSEGGITGTIMDPGPLYKQALMLNARGIIISHNHPSGNLQPSEQDKQITRKIKTGGMALDINVQDHLIICHSGYFSFSDNGLMPSDEKYAQQ